MTGLSILLAANSARDCAMAEASRQAHERHAAMWSQLYGMYPARKANPPRRERRTHCPSCGAPAEPVKCSYCGTPS